MLDLRQDIPKLKDFILSEIDNFHIKEGTLNALGVYSNPQDGWVSVSFNHNKTINESRNSCSSFQYTDFGRIEFDHWAEEFSSERPAIIDHTGSPVRLKKDFEVEDFHLLIYEAMVSALDELHLNEVAEEVLVQLEDSHFVTKYVTTTPLWM